jgi:CubicO group peptidase (beta-lactamase class C family)
MKKHHLLILLLILQYSAVAQDFTTVDSFFYGKVASRQLAGAVTLVARGGEILHFHSYGYMDAEQSVPMDKNALIPIASMTKVATSIGILILQEDGKPNIDDPVEKYLPQFRRLKVYVQPDSPATEDPAVKPIIRHLLNHTAGFGYGGKSYDEAGFREWNKPLSEFVDKITALPLAFQPGTNWKYSYSYDILGYLIEAVPASHSTVS